MQEKNFQKLSRSPFLNDIFFLKIKENIAFSKMSLCKEILHYIKEQSHLCPSFKHIPWTHRQGKEEHTEANLTLGEINPHTVIL